MSKKNYKETSDLELLGFQVSIKLPSNGFETVLITIPTTIADLKNDNIIGAGKKLKIDFVRTRQGNGLTQVPSRPSDYVILYAINVFFLKRNDIILKVTIRNPISER